MKRVIVPLADGFEEIEAVTIIDILRRAGLDAVTAGLDGTTVTGSHGITVSADVLLSDCDAGSADAIVLPGGMPGTARLLESEELGAILDSFHADGKLVGAICAAPTVLCARGILDGRRATSHPAHAHEMEGCDYSEDRVVCDGNVVTSRGAGTALEFSSELVRRLAGDQSAEDILDRIVSA